MAQCDISTESRVLRTEGDEIRVEDRGLKIESKAHGAKRKALGGINRRFSRIFADSLSRQDAKTAKKNIFLFSPNLAAFASLRESLHSAMRYAVR